MCMPKCVFWGPTRVIQYESEPVMNRLSMLPKKTQLTDILMSAHCNIARPKRLAGDGIKQAGVHLKVSVVAVGLWQMANAVGGQQQASGVPLLLRHWRKR